MDEEGLRYTDKNNIRLIVSVRECLKLHTTERTQ